MYIHACMHIGIDVNVVIDLHVDRYSVFYGYRRPSTDLELVCVAARSTQCSIM